MNPQADSYLENQILSATPQRLQLLLISGAIRFAQQARELWRNGREDAGSAALTRCREVVSEILSNIREEADEPARRTASLYAYLFQSLAMISLQRTARDLDDVIRVLEVERETWETVCERMPAAPERPRRELKEITAQASHAIAPSALACGGGPRGGLPAAATAGFDSNQIAACGPVASGGLNLDA